MPVSNRNARNRKYTLRYLSRRSYRLLKQLEFYEAPELKDIQAAQYWLALMPHPSGWYDDHSVAKTVVNNMKKTGDATIEEIKTRENVWGSANLDLLVRWVSAAMTIPFRNCVLWWPKMSSRNLKNHSLRTLNA